MTSGSTASSQPNVFVRLLSAKGAILSGAVLTLISLYPFLFDDDTRLRLSFDLTIYQGAIKHWLASGDLYGWALPPEKRYGFAYPPFAALLFSPINLLDSPRTLNAVFLFVNMAATVAVLVLSFRSLGLSMRLC